MSLDEIKKGVMEMYQGEIIGEVATNRMLACFDDPEQRYKIAIILQLETETKARLRPVLLQLGLDPTELEESRQAGHEFADALDGLGWTDAMAQLQVGLKPFVGRYLEVETIAPADYRELAHSMVVHEQSIYRFAELEAAGGTSHSVDDMVVQLAYPLPVPR